MAQLSARILLTLLILMLMLGAVGCRSSTASSPTFTATSSPSLTSTQTRTPTTTLTTTPAPTITPLPSRTPTITPTSYHTLSPTPSPSSAPRQPATLFTYEDANGRTVDWSYIYVTQIDFDQEEEVNDLWAFMAFQLLDRAIHQRSLDFLGETITVYYLNVAHNFDGLMIPMQLVLGGTPGRNIAIADIPAGGTMYVQVQIRDASKNFNPFTTHRDANREYEHRESTYPLWLLNEFESLLPTLPDEVILLADHPILFPQDEWFQVKLDMRRVSYLAARYHPFFAFDDYDRLVNQSDFAYALRDHILFQQAMPEGLYAYSSQTLIIIQGEE